MLDSDTIIGFIGAIVLVVGFLMNHLGKWTKDDFEYDFINLVGAAILAVYSWQIGSYPLLVLFMIWTLFSIKDVVWEGLFNVSKRKEKKEKKELEEELKKELEKEQKEGDNSREE